MKIVRCVCSSSAFIRTNTYVIRNFLRFASSSRLVKSDQENVRKVRQTNLIWKISNRISLLRNLDLIGRIRLLIGLKLNFNPSLSQLLHALKLKAVGQCNENIMESFKIKKLSEFSPPSTVRGMKVLNRSVFTRDIKVFGISVPVQNGTVVTRRFKNRLLKIPKIRSIAELGDDDPNHGTHKLFLFDPKQILSVESISESDVTFLNTLKIDVNSGKLYDVLLAYENWTYDEILDAVLPENTQGVGGFSVIGHIAHLNLKDNLLEYKQIIGDVLLDKINAVKTVVNKMNTIDNTYRNFQMELLAGENNFITVVKEHGLSYEFDFSKVYWNSRLGTEHQRIVADLSDHDVLYDVFAGVGPFAVPAAKKGCVVIANDLNPDSYSALQHNFKLNKVKGEFHLHNMDGRDFIRTVIKKDLLERWSSSTSANDDVDNLAKSKIHIVMNLPAIAIEFLNTFCGLIDSGELDSRGIIQDAISLPTVHCYCFSKSEDVVEDARQRTEQSLGVALSADSGATFRIVRNVAPNKEMLCASFTLPKNLLISSKIVEDSLEEPKMKKCRTS